MDVRTRKVRVTFLYLFLIGMLIIAASLVAHRLVSQEMLRQDGSLRGMFEWLPFVSSRRVPGVRVAILRSEQTARFLVGMAVAEDRDGEETRIAYQSIADFWQSYFRRRQIEAEIISDHDLEIGLNRFNLLIVPMAHCLSESQIQGVKDFLSQRRGVILTHISGNRDADGVERDWSLTGDVVGGTPYFLPLRDDRPQRLQLLAEIPITLNAPTAFELMVHGYNQLIGMNLRESRGHAAGLWADGGRVLPGGPFEEHAGMVQGYYLGGRFAWFGFDAQSVDSPSEMWQTFGTVMDDAIDWATHRTVIGKAPWPEHRAAVTFAIDPRQDFVRAAELQRAMTRRGVRPGFFVNARQAAINRMILAEIAPYVEFALQLDLPNPELLESGQSRNLEALIRTQVNELNEYMDAPFVGFSLPEAGRLDIDRLARLGFEYIWIDEERRLSPKYSHLTMQPLFSRRRAPVLIYENWLGRREGRDDAEAGRPEQVVEAMRSELRRKVRLGGVYTIKLRSDRHGSPTYVSLLDRWLSELPREQVWVAAPGEIASWWRMHENLKLDMLETAPGRMTLKISNEGRDAVPRFRVFIYPSRLPDNVVIRAERIYVPIPDYRLERELERVELVVERMGGRENRTYYIDFE